MTGQQAIIAGAQWISECAQVRTGANPCARIEDPADPPEVISRLQRWPENGIKSVHDHGRIERATLLSRALGKAGRPRRDTGKMESRSRIRSERPWYLIR